MNDSKTWNKAYATALREFAAYLEAKMSKRTVTAEEIITSLRAYAGAIERGPNAK